MSSPRSRTIDPITRDYVRDGGGRAYTRTIATSLYHTFATERGAWPGDPDAGCGIRRLARGNLGPGAEAEARNELEQAIAPYISEGLAAAPAIQIQLQDRRLAYALELTDTRAGRITLTGASEG